MQCEPFFQIKCKELQVISRKYWNAFQISEKITACRVPKFRIFFGLYCPIFCQNMGKNNQKKSPNSSTFHAVNTMGKLGNFNYLPNHSCQKFKFKCRFLTNLNQGVQSVGGIATSFPLSNLHFAEHAQSYRQQNPISGVLSLEIFFGALKILTAGGVRSGK